MEVILFVWAFFFIVVISGIAAYLIYFNKNEKKEVQDFLNDRKEGVDKNQNYQLSIDTLEKKDSEDEDPVIDLVPPMSLIPLPTPPNIPHFPTNLLPISPIPGIPKLLEKLEVSVPHPWSDDPVKLAMIKDALKNQTKNIGAGLIRKFENDIDKASKKVDISKNLKLISQEKMSQKKDSGLSKETKESLEKLKLFIGAPLILFFWWLFYTIKFDLHYYFLVLAIYLLLIAGYFYLKSGINSKPVNNYTTKVVDQKMISKAKAYSIAAYVIELFGIFLQSVIRGNEYSTLLGYIVLGICIFTFFYGLKKKNRYIALLSIYTIGVEIVAKFYDIFSTIFVSVPFWSYILVGAIALMDLTFIVLSKLEKKDESGPKQAGEIF